MVIAGTLADADVASIWFGPSVFLRWHRTYTHSILGVAAIVTITAVITVLLGGKTKLTPREILLALLLAAAAHPLLDLLQPCGETLLWPFRTTRFAVDLLPEIDPWILALLIAGIALPEVFRLVSSEIGAKDKSPRGRNGALIALSLLLVYIGGRYILHSNGSALLDAHSYRGESPRRVGVFPDTLSIFTWHGIVETQSIICELDVPLGPAGRFDAESATCQHKPESSPALVAAQEAKTAKEFLRAARYPKATVEKDPENIVIVIRDLVGASEPARHRVAARIRVGANAQVQSQELVWASGLRQP